MEKIEFYTYIDPKTQKYMFSYEPISLTQSFLRYHLIADEGKILVNNKTKEITRSIVIPKWELQNWVEKDR